MFGKIGDFIKPLVGATDKVPAEAVHKAHAVGEDTEKKPSPEKQDSLKPAGQEEDGESAKTRSLPHDDKTEVTLEAIRAYILARTGLKEPLTSSQNTSNKKSVPELYKSAISAYQKDRVDKGTYTELPPVSEHDAALQDLLEKMETLFQRGKRTISLEKGQTFADAIHKALDSPHE